MATENEQILEEIYFSEGGSGSFQSTFKLNLAAKQMGYNIPQSEIEEFLRKQESHYQFSDIKRQGIPKHVSIRTTMVNDASHLWHGDSAYVKTGWKGVHRFFVVFQDAFSKKLFARAVVKLTADSATRSFLDIIKTENDDNFPNTLVTDRGEDISLII